MSKYQIVDNFLPAESHARLKDMFSSSEFPWFFSRNMSYENDVGEKDDRNWFKFYHLFYATQTPQSQLYNELLPVIGAIKPISLISIRAFLTPYTGSKLNHGFHIDAVGLKNTEIENYLKSCVYYVNTNNGGTLFEDGTFVESVENRALFFSAKDVHSAVSQDNTSTRIIINFLYL